MKEQREIDFTDMILYLFAKWRKLLLGGIIFLIFGIIIALSYGTTNDNNIESVNEEMFTESEKDMLEMYNMYENQYEYWTDYVHESKIMNMDPMNARCSVLEYFISDSKYVNEIADLMKSNIYLNKKDFGEYGELLRVVISSSSTIVIDDFEIGKILYVYAYGNTDEECNEQQQNVQLYMDKIKSDLQQKFGQFKLEYISTQNIQIQDSTVNDYQNTQRNALYSTYNSKVTIYNLLSSNLKEYINNRVVCESNLNIVEHKATFDKKQIIILPLSFIIGILVICFLYIYIYIFDNRIKMCDDYSKIFDVNVFAIVLKKINLKGLDKLFSTMRHKNISYFEEEEFIKICVLQLKTKLALIDKKEVFITGTNIGDAERDIFNSIKKELEEYNIKMIIGDSILHSVDSFEKMVKVGVVLTVETCNKSNYSEVLRLVNQINEYNIINLGLVVME